MRKNRHVGRELVRALTAIGFAAVFCAPALAADSAYTVANYPVDATAANAVAAKEQALADGQQAALRSLLKRIVPVTAYKQLTRVASLKAQDLVAGVAVRSERNSSTDYIANLDFSFQADAIRAALSKEGIPFVDTQAAPIILVTALVQGNPPTASNDKGVWRRAWSELDLQHTITPAKLQDLKPEMTTEVVTELMAGDDKGLAALTTAYGTQLIVVAIAEADLAAKKMTVTLAGRDAVGPLLLKRSYRISNGDLPYTSELAAVVGLGVLEGRWKAVHSSGSQATAAAVEGAPVWSASTTGSGEDVTFTAQFATNDQWNEMRAQLLDTPGVDALDVASVSDRDANIALKFPGGAHALANALGARGLSLVNTDQGWYLRPNN